MTALSTANPGRSEHASPEAERLLAALVVGRANPREIDSGSAAAAVLLAVEHGLAPVLLAAVRDAKIHPAGSAWAPLVDHARRIAWRYLLARVEQSRIEAALAPLGIEWVWLKGYALAHSVYPRPALRPMLDLDVLVPADRCEEADGVVRALGYRGKNAPPLFRGIERALHHTPPLWAPSGVMLELHTRLHPSEQLLPTAHLAWFRAQTMETQSADVRVRHLKAEAQLLHLTSHAILQHGEGDLRLQRYYDCHLLVSRTPQFDWKLLLDKAAALGWTYAVERALTNSRDYFQTPVADHVWRALRDRRGRTREATPATGFAIALKRPDTVSLRDATGRFAPSLSFRLHVVLRALFPSCAYMRWRYGADAGPLPIVYARRWYDLARKLMRRRRRSRS